MAMSGILRRLAVPCVKRKTRGRDCQHQVVTKGIATSNKDARNVTPGLTSNEATQLLRASSFVLVPGASAPYPMLR